MGWYDTPEEELDVEALKSFGYVENPNSHYWHQRVAYAKLSKLPVMDLFATHIKEEADVVAFRRYNDGSLGAGVAREVLEARIWGKKVWEVTSTPYGVRVTTGSEYLKDVLTVVETRDHNDNGGL
jgi:hypothetical protein